MRLGINMLNHPPQPFIIVCVCVFADRKQVGGEQRFRYTYSYTQTYTNMHAWTQESICTQAETDTHKQPT